MLSPAEAENSVREALKMGYSLVDTANAYVNERACGRGIKDSGLKREQSRREQRFRSSIFFDWRSTPAAFPVSDVRRRSTKVTASAGMDLRLFWMQSESRMD